MMDTLSFEKETVEFLGQEYICAKIVINGIPLLERVTPIELPYARAEGHPDNAGAYNHQQSELLYKQLIGEWLYYPDAPQVALLTCLCFDDGCWSLQAECKESEEDVVWRKFFHNHRDEWDYSALSEFHFEKNQYNEELLKLREFDKGSDS